jgi:hypothetical protein
MGPFDGFHISIGVGFFPRKKESTCTQFVKVSKERDCFDQNAITHKELINYDYFFELDMITF